jgi:hypothetical protein
VCVCEKERGGWERDRKVKFKPFGCFTY